MPTLSAQAITVLRGYHWPGNIRELRNVMERAVLLASDDVITLEHLPLDRLARPIETRGPSAVPPADRATIAPLPRRLPERDPDERERIEAALAQCGGNQSKAAKLLGVSRRTLVSRIVEYAIRRPRDE